jgi:hypothetical protein
MAVTTVRPNAVVTGSGNYDNTGGAASIQAALSDDSNTTYISKKAAVTGEGSIILDFGTTTLTASQKVKRVRVRAKIKTDSAGTGKLNVYLGSKINNQNYYHSPLQLRGTYGSITTLEGAYQVAAPDGSAWTQTSINNLRAKVTEYQDSTNISNIYELYIDVDIVSEPTVTVVNPNGTITNTASPDVSWTFADSDGDTQTYYQIKVFSAAQYGAGGFDPETSTATYDSGEIAGSDTDNVVDDLLANATYRAYMKVAKTINNEPFWSDWAYSGFVINNTLPPTPTLAAVFNNATNDVTLTATGSSPTGFSSQVFDIHRSDNAGTIYAAIRNGEELIPNGSFIASVTDYEAPRGISAYYRVRSIGTTAGGVEIPSAWSTVVQVLITNDTTWWFKAIADPTINIGGIRVLAQLDTNIDEPNTVFRPLGETRPIVVAGPLQGEDGVYQIKTVTETEWDDFYPIIEHQGTLLVQDPLLNQKLIRVVGRTWSAESSQNSVIYRDIELAYVEVDE